MLKRYKYPFLLAGSVALICGCMFLPNLLAHIPVTYGTDLKPEQLFFNMEFTNLMNQFFKTGTLPFYSWSMFLGTNFFSSQTFYIMGDPFTCASLLFQGLNFFDRTLLLEILKFFVSAFSMFALLRTMKISSKISLFGGLCYAFSGWAIFFSGQLMFHSFYCLVPLYFCGIEKYLASGKKIQFLLMTAILLISHWYFFYTLSFLTPFYYIYRYSLIKQNFKYFVSDTLKLIGVYFVGVMIAGVILVPTICYMSGNNRIGFNTDLIFQDPQVYLHFLASMFVPNYQYIYGVNVFETDWHVTREICIWAGSLTALLMCQMMWIKDRVFKKRTLLFYGAILILAIMPMGDAALHGFSDPSFRWTFLLTLFNILTASWMLENYEQIDSTKIIGMAIIAAVICIGIIPLAGFVEGKSQMLFRNYLPQILLFSSFGFLIFIEGLLLKRRAINLLIIITVLEFSLSGGLHYLNKMDRSERGSYSFVQQVTHVLQDKDQDLNNYLNYLDSDNYSQYYRIFVPYDSLYWSYSHNMSVAYQLNGLMIYDSTYSPSINKLAELNPDIKAYNSGMMLNIEDPSLMTFLNVKYALVLEEDELPQGVQWNLIQNDYRGNIRIYENLDYRALGTTYSSILTYDEFIENGESIQILNDHILCDPKDYHEIKDFLSDSDSVNLEEISYGGNQLTGKIKTSSDTFMIITLPYDDGWKILVNGKEVKKYNVNGGFIGIALNKGESHLEMYFVPEGFKLGMTISAFGCILAVVLFGLERKKKHEYKEK